jgi:hypothetical protein
MNPVVAALPLVKEHLSVPLDRMEKRGVLGFHLVVVVPQKLFERLLENSSCGSKAEAIKRRCGMLKILTRKLAKWR